MANFTWLTTPFLVSCATFTVFVLTQRAPLTTDLIFPALTLFNLLTFPLAALPMVISAVVEASVAVGRLTSFLTAEEMQPDAVLRKEAVTQAGKEAFRIREATFTWNKAEPRPALTNVNLSAKKGELICVVGRVGAGKSSLLQAALGDLWKICGEVVVYGTTAYVAQQPWVMNATVKENIVFGYRWDPSFYNATISACALLDDFQVLPDGDQTEVGERGISLSGGQKARLALARAVYARADVYLLDDVLSAVDQHVGRHLIENVLGPTGLLSGKTRILATNSIPVLNEADSIVLIRDGSIVEQGTYDELKATNGEVADLIRTSHTPDEAQDSASDASRSEHSLTAIESDASRNEGEVAEAREDVAYFIPLSSKGGRARASSMTTIRRASAASFRGPRERRSDEEEAKNGAKTRQTKESTEQGKVRWKVYAEYARASNLWAVALYLIMMIGAQSGQVGEYILFAATIVVRLRQIT